MEASTALVRYRAPRTLASAHIRLPADRQAVNGAAWFTLGALIAFYAVDHPIAIFTVTMILACLWWLEKEQ